MKKITAFLCVLLNILLFSSASSGSVQHVVQKGDTLYAVSRKYNVSVTQLCSANSLTMSSILKPGQVLNIPSQNAAADSAQKSKSPASTLPAPAVVSGTGSASAPAASASSSSVSSAVPSSVPAASAQKTASYTVVKGDTLYSIAKKWDISLDTLRIMNKMSGNDTLKIGQVLTVPGGSAESGSSAAASVLELTDPRTYNSAKPSDLAIKWPVKPSEVLYISGKVSGVKLVCAKNERAAAVRNGTVMYSGFYRGYGQVVFIQSSSDYMYVYMGLEKILVSKGQQIKAGTDIGIAGVDALSGKAGIYFSVFKNGKPINPAKAPR